MKTKGTQQSIIAYYEKESPAATEFRRIYTKLTAQKGESRPRTILMTSSTLGEGKSIISSLMGITAANLTGEKTAIIDLDLRRPKIHEYFAINQSPGIADVLSKKSNIKSVTRGTPIPNLSIITAGKVDGSPSDIFDKADIPGLIQELKFYFDTIILDSPPLIPVSDPMLIADQVDGVIVVIKGGSTPREVVSRAINLINNSGVNLLGVILNDLESVLPYYYKDRYYGYHYSSTSKK